MGEVLDKLWNDATPDHFEFVPNEYQEANFYTTRWKALWDTEAQHGYWWFVSPVGNPHHIDMVERLLIPEVDENTNYSDTPDLYFAEGDPRFGKIWTFPNEPHVAETFRPLQDAIAANMPHREAAREPFIDPIDMPYYSPHGEMWGWPLLHAKDANGYYLGTQYGFHSDLYDAAYDHDKSLYDASVYEYRLPPEDPDHLATWNSNYGEWFDLPEADRARILDVAKSHGYHAVDASEYDPYNKHTAQASLQAIWLTPEQIEETFQHGYSVPTSYGLPWPDSFGGFKAIMLHEEPETIYMWPMNNREAPHHTMVEKWLTGKSSGDLLYQAQWNRNGDPSFAYTYDMDPDEKATVDAFATAQVREHLAQMTHTAAQAPEIVWVSPGNDTHDDVTRPEEFGASTWGWPYFKQDGKIYISPSRDYHYELYESPEFTGEQADDGVRGRVDPTTLDAPRNTLNVYENDWDHDLTDEDREAIRNAIQRDHPQLIRGLAHAPVLMDEGNDQLWNRREPGDYFAGSWVYVPRTNKLYHEKTGYGDTHSDLLENVSVDGIDIDNEPMVLGQLWFNYDTGNYKAIAFTDGYPEYSTSDAVARQEALKALADLLGAQQRTSAIQPPTVRPSPKVHLVDVADPWMEHGAGYPVIYVPELNEAWTANRSIPHANLMDAADKQGLFDWNTHGQYNAEYPRVNQNGKLNTWGGNIGNERIPPDMRDALVHTFESNQDRINPESLTPWEEWDPDFRAHEGAAIPPGYTHRWLFNPETNEAIVWPYEEITDENPVSHWEVAAQHGWLDGLENGQIWGGAVRDGELKYWYNPIVNATIVDAALPPQIEQAIVRMSERGNQGEEIFKIAAAPQWNWQNHNTPGLPRPIWDGMPIPWSAGDFDHEEPNLATADWDKLNRANQIGLCILCAEKLNDPVYVFSDEQGQALDGGLHQRCAALTAAHCPHIKQGLAEGSCVFVSVPLAEWNQAVEEISGGIITIPEENTLVRDSAVETQIILDTPGYEHSRFVYSPVSNRAVLSLKGLHADIIERYFLDELFETEGKPADREYEDLIAGYVYPNSIFRQEGGIQIVYPNRKTYSPEEQTLWMQAIQAAQNKISGSITSSTQPQVVMVDTAPNSERGRPIIYSPKSNIAYVGSPTSFHSDLIEHIPWNEEEDMHARLKPPTDYDDEHVMWYWREPENADQIAQVVQNEVSKAGSGEYTTTPLEPSAPVQSHVTRLSATVVPVDTTHTVDYGDSMVDGSLPFIYRPLNDTIYVGKPNGYHDGVFEAIELSIDPNVYDWEDRTFNGRYVYNIDEFAYSSRVTDHIYWYTQPPDPTMVNDVAATLNHYYANKHLGRKGGTTTLPPLVVWERGRPAPEIAAVLGSSDILPTLNQLQKYRCDEGECYEYTGWLTKDFPALKWEAGAYRDDRLKDHAWAVAPDGTIYDTTHAQFDPQVPIMIAKSGTPEHAKYLAADDMTDDERQQVYHYSVFSKYLLPVFYVSKGTPKDDFIFVVTNAGIALSNGNNQHYELIEELGIGSATVQASGYVENGQATIYTDRGFLTQDQILNSLRKSGWITKPITKVYGAGDILHSLPDKVVEVPTLPTDAEGRPVIYQDGTYYVDGPESHHYQLTEMLNYDYGIDLNKNWTDDTKEGVILPNGTLEWYYGSPKTAAFAVWYYCLLPDGRLLLGDEHLVHYEIYEKALEMGFTDEELAEGEWGVMMSNGKILIMRSDMFPRGEDRDPYEDTKPEEDEQAQIDHAFATDNVIKISKMAESQRVPYNQFNFEQLYAPLLYDAEADRVYQGHPVDGSHADWIERLEEEGNSELASHIDQLYGSFGRNDGGYIGADGTYYWINERAPATAIPNWYYDEPQTTASLENPHALIVPVNPIGDRNPAHERAMIWDGQTLYYLTGGGDHWELYDQIPGLLDADDTLSEGDYQPTGNPPYIYWYHRDMPNIQGCFAACEKAYPGVLIKGVEGLNDTASTKLAIIPISEPHFPARRFVWSSLQGLPEVGPLIGMNQPPVHKQLYNKLEQRFSDPMQMWEGKLVGGWLEYDPRSQTYELSPIPSDGSSWQELDPQSQQELKTSLDKWALQSNVRLAESLEGPYKHQQLEYNYDEEDPWDNERRPVVYSPAAKTFYIGYPGDHHASIYEYGPADLNEESEGQYPLQGFIVDSSTPRPKDDYSKPGFWWLDNPNEIDSYEDEANALHQYAAQHLSPTGEVWSVYNTQNGKPIRNFAEPNSTTTSSIKMVQWDSGVPSSPYYKYLEDESGKGYWWYTSPATDQPGHLEAAMELQMPQEFYDDDAAWTLGIGDTKSDPLGVYRKTSASEWQLKYIDTHSIDPGRSQNGYPVLADDENRIAYIGNLGAHHSDVIEALYDHGDAAADDYEQINVWPPGEYTYNPYSDHPAPPNKDWIAVPYGGLKDQGLMRQLEEWAKNPQKISAIDPVEDTTHFFSWVYLGEPYNKIFVNGTAYHYELAELHPEVEHAFDDPEIPQIWGRVNKFGDYDDPEFEADIWSDYVSEERVHYDEDTGDIDSEYNPYSHNELIPQAMQALANELNAPVHYAEQVYKPEGPAHEQLSIPGINAKLKIATDVGVSKWLYNQKTDQLKVWPAYSSSVPHFLMAQQQGWNWNDLWGGYWNYWNDGKNMLTYVPFDRPEGTGLPPGLEERIEQAHQQQNIGAISKQANGLDDYRWLYNPMTDQLEVWRFFTSTHFAKADSLGWADQFDDLWGGYVWDTTRFNLTYTPEYNQGIPDGLEQRVLDECQRQTQSKSSSYNASKVVNQVRSVLSPDLLHKDYQDNPKAHCYVASEAVYHLMGGPDSGLKPTRLRLPDGTVHWWLTDQDGSVIDPTHDQFEEPVDYSQGRGSGFLTRQPSKRAQTVIDRVNDTYGKTSVVDQIQKMTMFEPKIVHVPGEGPNWEQYGGKDWWSGVMDPASNTLYIGSQTLHHSDLYEHAYDHMGLTGNDKWNYPFKDVTWYPEANQMREIDVERGRVPLSVRSKGVTSETLDWLRANNPYVEGLPQVTSSDDWGWVTAWAYSPEAGLLTGANYHYEYFGDAYGTGPINPEEPNITGWLFRKGTYYYAVLASVEYGGDKSLKDEALAALRREYTPDLQMGPPLPGMNQDNDSELPASEYYYGSIDIPPEYYEIAEEYHKLNVPCDCEADNLPHEHGNACDPDPVEIEDPKLQQAIDETRTAGLRDFFKPQIKWIYDLDDQRLYTGEGHHFDIIDEQDVPMDHRLVYGYYLNGKPYLDMDIRPNWVTDEDAEKALFRAKTANSLTLRPLDMSRLWEDDVMDRPEYKFALSVTNNTLYIWETDRQQCPHHYAVAASLGFEPNGTGEYYDLAGEDPYYSYWGPHAEEVHQLVMQYLGSRRHSLNWNSYKCRWVYDERTGQIETARYKDENDLANHWALIDRNGWNPDEVICGYYQDGKVWDYDGQEVTEPQIVDQLKQRLGANEIQVHTYPGSGHEDGDVPFVYEPQDHSIHMTDGSGHHYDIYEHYEPDDVRADDEAWPVEGELWPEANRVVLRARPVSIPSELVTKLQQIFPDASVYALDGGGMFTHRLAARIHFHKVNNEVPVTQSPIIFNKANNKFYINPNAGYAGHWQIYNYMEDHNHVWPESTDELHGYYYPNARDSANQLEWTGVTDPWKVTPQQEQMVRSTLDAMYPKESKLAEDTTNRADYGFKAENFGGSPWPRGWEWMRSWIYYPNKHLLLMGNTQTGHGSVISDYVSQAGDESVFEEDEAIFGLILFNAAKKEYAIYPEYSDYANGMGRSFSDSNEEALQAVAQKCAEKGLEPLAGELNVDGTITKVASNIKIEEAYSAIPEERHDAWIYDPVTNTLYFLHGGHHAEIFESLLDPYTADEHDTWQGDIENGEIRFYDSMRDRDDFEDPRHEEVLNLVKSLSQDYNPEQISVDYHTHAKVASPVDAMFKWTYPPGGPIRVWPTDANGHPSHMEVAKDEIETDAQGHIYIMDGGQPFVYVHPERPWPKGGYQAGKEFMAGREALQQEAINAAKQWIYEEMGQGIAEQSYKNQEFHQGARPKKGKRPHIRKHHYPLFGVYV